MIGYTDYYRFKKNSCADFHIFDIFYFFLKICNWPDATECVEDPTAELPEEVSSDVHPPKPRQGHQLYTTHTPRHTFLKILVPSIFKKRGRNVYLLKCSFFKNVHCPCFQKC